MKKIIDYIAEELADAFEKAGYDRAYGKVTLSNRPDLCEYQCNGAMAGAKAYKKAPFMIAENVVALLKDSACMEEVEVVKPGFINIRLKKAFVADYLNQMEEAEDLGIQKAENPEMIVVDYGGPNVAKPLHVGHLRSAIIGESVKRIARKMGHEVLGDIHLGDWGYQMGLIITELKERKPELPYFDESFEGEYPKEAPFTISELEEIYPTASGKAKEDDAYRENALHATYLLQNGHRGYRAIWNHIINVSVSDLKRNYANLNVSFDLWKGESDAQAYKLTSGLLLIPIMVVIATVLPGNQVLPVVDLLAIPYMVQGLVAVYKGNMSKILVAGVIWFSLGLLMCTYTAPLFTDVARGAGFAIPAGAAMITSFNILGKPMLGFVFLAFLSGNPLFIGIAVAVYAVAFFIFKTKNAQIVAYLDRQADKNDAANEAEGA